MLFDTRWGSSDHQNSNTGVMHCVAATRSSLAVHESRRYHNVFECGQFFSSARQRATITGVARVRGVCGLYHHMPLARPEQTVTYYAVNTSRPAAFREDRLITAAAASIDRSTLVSLLDS